MNDISDKSMMAALGRQMSIAVAKQASASSNLANIDTPGYKTRDVSFDDALERELGVGQLATTEAGHLSPGTMQLTEVKDVEGLPVRRDGNNVQLDRELLHMTRASGDFSAAQTALAAKFRLVRYAINEGK